MRGTRAQTGRELTSDTSPQRAASHGSSMQAGDERVSADTSSQSGALSPPVSTTSSPDLLLQSENTTSNQTSPPFPATPARSSGAITFEERMFAFMTNMQQELRQDVLAVRNDIQMDITILRQEFVAASSARSESLPLPSQPGPVEHSQHIRTVNNNGRLPLQAAGGAPYDPDHDDSEEDEDDNPNQADPSDFNISISSPVASEPHPTRSVALVRHDDGGGGDDSSDDPNGNDDFHSVDSDEDTSSPNPPLTPGVPSESSGSSESGSRDSPPDPIPNVLAQM